MPRKVRDDNPRFTLSPSSSAGRPREGLAQAWVSMARRAAGTFARLPKNHVARGTSCTCWIVKTVVFRLKGDLAGGPRCRARGVDKLLAGDDDLATRPSATLAYAHYQSGMTRLLWPSTSSAHGRASAAATASPREPRTHAVVAADSAAEAIALVRALEGEAEHATSWLTSLEGSSRIRDRRVLSRSALISIGRLDDARRPATGSSLLADVRDSDEFWAFAAHAEQPLRPVLGRPRRDRRRPRPHLGRPR